MPNIKNLPPHLRPREKLLARGADTLTIPELLAILIRTGRAGHDVISIATSIHKKYPDLSKITHENLQDIKGLDIAKTSSILAALELARRLNNTSVPLISKPTDALPYLRE